MEPIKPAHIKTKMDYELFGVTPENYETFVALKNEIIANAEKGKSINHKKILQCFTMLHDLREGNEKNTLSSEDLKKYIELVCKYFRKQRNYYFPRDGWDYWKEEIIKTLPNGFEDLVSYIILDVFKKQQEGTVKNATDCTISLIMGMRNWYLKIKLEPHMNKGQICIIACYIAKHVFGFYESYNLNQSTAVDKYYIAVNNILKKNKRLAPGYYSPFTVPSKK